MRIVGLDLSSAYGWAVVRDGVYVVSGNGRLPNTVPIGARCGLLREVIADLITEYEPDLLAIEAPIHTGAFTSLQVARALYSYAAAAEEVAYMRELRLVEYARSTCCKEVIGNGRAKKPDGLAFARTLNDGIWSVDEADAVLVALTAAKLLGKKANRFERMAARLEAANA